MSTVFGFGFGGFGQAGTGSYLNQAVPTETTALSRLHVSKIAIGLWHTLIITDEGRLFSVGRGRYGALGLGADETDNMLYPNEVITFKRLRVIDAACGKTHSLCVTDDGRIWSFGFGLGRGLGNTELTGQPEVIEKLLQYKVVQVAAGEYHSACVTSCGKLFTFGLESRFPVEVKSPNGSQFVKVKCGAKHVFGLTANGALYGFGNNSDYQVGGMLKKANVEYDNPVVIRVPATTTDVDYGTYWTDFDCGYRCTLALSNKNQLFVWGTLRIGTNVPAGLLPEPSHIQLPSDLAPASIKTIACGASFFAILTHDGRLYTWGSNMHSNLGHGKENVSVPTPTLVSQLTGVSLGKLFVGGYNVMALSGSNCVLDLKNLLEEEMHADIIVKCNSKLKKAHKALLCARSPVLQSLINLQLPSVEAEEEHPESETVEEEYSKSGTSETQTVNKEMDVLNLSSLVDESVLSYILEFIYTNMATKIPPEHVETFKEAAKSLGLTEVIVQMNSASADNKSYVEQLQKLVNSPHSHYDVLFALDDGSMVKVHRSILSCRAEYFKAMFSSSFVEGKQSTVEFHDCTSEAFLKLMNFMYTGEIEAMEPSLAVAMLELGARINWPRIKNVAEHVIIQNLDPENVIQMISVSDLCDSPTIRKACIYYIAERYESFASTEQFKTDLDEITMEEINVTYQAVLANKKSQGMIEEQESNFAKIEAEFQKKREERQKEQLFTVTSAQDEELVGKVLHKKQCIVM